MRQNDVDLESDEFGNNFIHAFVTPLRPAILDHNIAAFNPLSLRNRCVKAVSHGPTDESVVGPRNPIVGSLTGCCARAASGQAAAPPISDMNSRLFK
jgi:hypothetical protein